MIGNILGIIWVILLVGIAFLLIRKAGQHETLHFQLGRKPDVPHIKVKSGDVELNMIVDTGAGASIIDKRLLDKLEYEEMDEKISMSALTPDSVEANIVLVPLIINNKKVLQKFGVVEADDLCNSRALYSIVAHGILGSDFLEATNGHVDYKKQAVIFP